MNPAGVPTDKRLIDVDRKAGKVTISPPRIENGQNSPEYSVVRFDNIMTIAPTFRVGADKKPAFDQMVKTIQADPNFRSKLKPEDQISIVAETAPKKGMRGNHNGKMTMPSNFTPISPSRRMAALLRRKPSKKQSRRRLSKSPARRAAS